MKKLFAKPLGNPSTTGEPSGFLFMEMYKCITCLIEKPISEYRKRLDTRRGIVYCCRSCSILREATYRRSEKGVIKRIYNDQRKSSKLRGHAPPNYSLSEFSTWVFSQNNFKSIYNSWVESNYEHLMTVSCDRLDDYKPYTLCNIRLTTWGENKRKGHDDRMNGSNRKQSIGVYHLDEEGKIIGEYHSMSDARRKTGDSLQKIKKRCHGVVKNPTGKTWMFSTEKTRRLLRDKEY